MRGCREKKIVPWGARPRLALKPRQKKSWSQNKSWGLKALREKIGVFLWSHRLKKLRKKTCTRNYETIVNRFCTWPSLGWIFRQLEKAIFGARYADFWVFSGFCDDFARERKCLIKKVLKLIRTFPGETRSLGGKAKQSSGTSFPAFF